MTPLTSNMPPAGRLAWLKRLAICALAGLLIFYHLYILVEMYVGPGTDLYEAAGVHTHPLFEHLQSLLRVMIVVSLVLVALNRGVALYGMWAGISALIATHYWALFHDLPFQFLEGRHPASYLKGFIIPSVITLLCLSLKGRAPPTGSSD